ncbi:unnamed protein product, partial [marine sediment metagenome]
KPFSGDQTFPSVLGRDVIHKLSLCYCKEKDYLGLTEQNPEYFNLLSEIFPSLGEDEEVPWID